MKERGRGERVRERERTVAGGARRAGSGLVSGLVLALLALGLAWGLWRGVLQRERPARAADLLTYRVAPLELAVTARETGTLESASSIRVYSEVDGRVPIVSLVPEGTPVAAGDVVVELESAPLETGRTEQQIAVEKARAALSQAQQDETVARSQSVSDVQAAELAVEFAELDLKKYLEGDYPLERRALQTEIDLAEEVLERARAPLSVLEELERDGYLNASELEAERFKEKRAQLSVEIARDRLQVLETYTFQRKKRELESKVTEARRALERVRNLAQAALAQAETKLKAEESALRLEEEKLARLEDQIRKCTLRAPQAGVVVYPVPEDEDMVELFIREGTEIRRRQHVFSIPDTDVLEVAAAFNEAIVNRLRPGMPARVRIEVGELELRGELRQVSSLPDPQDWRRTTVKFYQTRIALLEQAEGLRPGMTAMVEILIERQPEVLALPVQSVVQRGKQGVCYVLENGVPVLRRLELGSASIEHVAVLSGVSAGELVVLAPDPLGIPAEAFPAEAPAPAAFGAADGGAPALPAPDPAAAAPIQETEYKAVLLGADGLLAEAEYEIQSQGGSELKREFDVEVRGGLPGATWEVAVAGVVIGSVTLDATGYGLGEWSTKKGTMPEDFPREASHGTAVTIGPELAGALAR